MEGLRPTLALWLLALLAHGRVVGCTAEARGEQAPGSADASVPPPGPEGTTAADRAPEPAPARTPGPPILTITAVGDCTLGDTAGAERAVGSFHRAFADGDYARPFSGVQAVLGTDDLTIANLETTLTTEPHRSDTAFAFRGKPEFARMLELGSVDVVSIANNHSADCGPSGLRETKKSLESVGVGYFGMGHVDRRTVRGVEVVNLGYLGGRVEVRPEVMKDVAANKRPENLVIVSFHWGIEGSNATGIIQKQLGRAAVDAGADLVLGHHPHVLQGIETYRGRKIVYSLGNFVFGGHAQPEDFDSMIYRAQFTVKDGSVTPLADEIIPVHYSGNPVQNDFRPVLLEGPEKARVLSAIDGYTALLSKQR